MSFMPFTAKTPSAPRDAKEDFLRASRAIIRLSETWRPWRLGGEPYAAVGGEA
jgi:hypothetical protein